MMRLLIVFVLIMSFLIAQTTRSHPSINRVRTWYTTTNEVVQIDRPWVYDNGILFTYNGQSLGIEKKNAINKIYLSGSFLNWNKKIVLKKNFNGIYQVFFSQPIKLGKHTYRFWVNGLWINDKEQPYVTVDKSGEKLSFFILDENLSLTIKGSPEKIGLNKYRFYLKDKNYNKVYWSSSEVGWNIFLHKMKLKNGYWMIDEIINKSQLYIFWVDGNKMFDPLNSKIYKTSFGFKANLIEPVMN